MGLIDNKVDSIDKLLKRTTGKTSGRIHHYTSLNSLVSIIVNKCFRFTRIDLLNDKKEESFARLNNNEKMYNLSFSQTGKESVAMWKMYGGSGQKVRISLSRRNLIESFNDNIYFDNTLKSKVPDDCFIKGAGAFANKNFSITDVVYLDGRNSKIRFNGKAYECVDKYRDKFKGFMKYDCWEFESESRLTALLDKTILNNEPPKYLYGKINKKLLENINITFDPWTSGEMKTFIKSGLNMLAESKLSYSDSELEGEIEWI